MYIETMIGIVLLGVLLLVLAYFAEKSYHYDDFAPMLAMVGFICIVLFSWLIPGLMFEAYGVPQLEIQANEYCISNGYDAFDDYSSIGLFPTEPVAIRCKYVDNSRTHSGEITIMNKESTQWN